MNPDKADDYAAVMAAAAAWRQGEKDYARTVLAFLDDPHGDLLSVLGVVLAMAARMERARGNDPRAN